LCFDDFETRWVFGRSEVHDVLMQHTVIVSVWRVGMTLHTAKSVFHALSLRSANRVKFRIVDARCMLE
jgi:hypothetical protein